MTLEDHVEISASLVEVCMQLKALVSVVRELSEEKNFVDEPPVLYTAETSDQQEMNRILKADDALMALNDIVNDAWQRGMIHHGGADQVLSPGTKDPLTPSEAMRLYRDHIFDVLQQRGIVLDDLL
jgi:hypothetical protein